MRRLLLTGSAGQVGQELRQALVPLGTVVATDRNTLDLTQPETIRQMVQEVHPDVIVNAAAYTAVDQAELNVDTAYAINATAPTVLAEEAQRLGAALIHISTDYVFDGTQSTPYTEEDTPNPIGVYGKSKLAGEQGIRQNCDRHLILRTAWVYGTYGKGNFVKTMLRLGTSREEVRVVMDQIGAPTWSRDVASAIASLIPLHDREPPDHAPSITGTFHFTNSGTASWYDFAVAIFAEAATLGIPLTLQRVLPVTTAEYPTPARRPPYSVLALDKITAALGQPPAPWQQQLQHMLIELYSHSYEGTYSLRR